MAETNPPNVAAVIDARLHPHQSFSHRVMRDFTSSMKAIREVPMKATAAGLASDGFSANMGRKFLRVLNAYIG